MKHTSNSKGTGAKERKAAPKSLAETLEVGLEKDKPRQQ